MTVQHSDKNSYFSKHGCGPAARDGVYGENTELPPLSVLSEIPTGRELCTPENYSKAIKHSSQMHN